MAEQVSARRTAEAIIQTEELFPFQSLAEDTAVRSTRGILEYLKTPVVKARIMQEVDK